MDERERLAILDEIIAVTERPRLKPYQFTRMEYQERAGVTQGEAQTLLGTAVKDGLLKREKVYEAGHWTVAYWRPEDELE